VRAATEALSVELVLTAHPTEAVRRTVLEKHRRIASLLHELDDPDLPRSTEKRVHHDLAEEVTILWQTDEVRSQRPRVVDEIRQTLWFVEESLWHAAPRAPSQSSSRTGARGRRALSPTLRQLGRGATWTATLNTGGATIEAALDQARTLARDLLQRDVSRACSLLGDVLDGDRCGLGSWCG